MRLSGELKNLQKSFEVTNVVRTSLEKQLSEMEKRDEILKSERYIKTLKNKESRIFGSESVKMDIEKS